MTQSLSLTSDSTLNRLLVAIFLRAEDDGLVARVSIRSLSESLGRDRQEVLADLCELVKLGHVSELEADGGESQDERVLVLMDHEAAHWYVSETRMAKALRRALEVAQVYGPSDAASIN